MENLCNPNSQMPSKVQQCKQHLKKGLSNKDRPAMLTLFCIYAVLLYSIPGSLQHWWYLVFSFTLIAKSSGWIGECVGNQNNERVLCKHLILSFAAEVIVFFIFIYTISQISKWISWFDRSYVKYGSIANLQEINNCVSLKILKLKTRVLIKTYF